MGRLVQPQAHTSLRYVRRSGLHPHAIGGIMRAQREIAELRARLDQPAADLERIIDDLQKKLDTVVVEAKRPQFRPVRREEPSKDLGKLEP